MIARTPRLLPRWNDLVCPIGCSRSHLAAILAAIIGTFLFAVPILEAFKPGSADWPAFLLSGDIRMQLFPQFISGYYRFWHGGIFGTDFATDGGASIFGLRPNMLQFYPPYILLYLFFDVSKPSVAAAALSLLQLIHMAACLFFTVRLGTRFLGLRRGAAILFALVYGLSYTTCQYFSFFLYFFQIALVPLVAYCLCILMLSRNLRSAILLSPVFLVYILTNYGPTMVMGLLVALLVSGYVFLTRIQPQLSDRISRLIFPAISLGIAGAVAAPIYIAEQLYHGIASVVPRDIDTTAFSGSFSGGDIVSAFSWILPGATPTEGSLHWGLLPPAVLLIGLLILVDLRRGETRLRSLALWSLAIFFCFVFVSFGRSSIGADILYISVPILGSMHLFQRYLMFGQIFFWLSFAISAQLFVFRARDSLRKIALILAFVIWLVASLILGLHPDASKLLNTGWLLTELLVFLVGFLVLCFGRSSVALAALAIPVLATSLWPLFGQSRSLGVSSFWDSHIGYKSQDLDRLSQLLSAGKEKQLSKVLDLTSDIDSYVPRNEPWILFARGPLMNFMGYEPHLAMEKEYLEMMGGSYGHFNRSWVLATGVDTVIWNTASETDLKALTADIVSVESTQTISPGVFVSRLRYEAPGTGEELPLVSLPETDPSVWHPFPLDGWTMDGGRAVKIANGKNGTFSIPFYPVPGRIYTVSIDVLNSSKGSLTLSFGNIAYPEEIRGSEPGTYTRQYTAKEPGGLWVNASPEFDGAVSNISIGLVSDKIVKRMPIAADNGVLRLEARPGTAAFTDFSTDWSTVVTAHLKVSESARLVYLLWPNRYMIPYLDGKPVQWQRSSGGPGFLEISEGEHLFELCFESSLASLFVFLIKAFLLLIAMTIIFCGFEGRLRRMWARYPFGRSMRIDSGLP